MRILQITEYFWPRTGGSPINDSLLAAALVDAGHEVTVIADPGAEDLPPRDEYRGVRIRRLEIRRALSAGSSPAELLALLRAVQQIAREATPDLLHATMMAGPSMFLVAKLAERNPALPLVVTFQREVGAGEQTGPDTLLGRVLRRAGAVTCVSERTRQQLLAVFPEAAAKTSTVYPSLPDPGPPAPLPSEPHLLCLGRLVEVKGFDLAVEALARLAPPFDRRRDRRGERWPSLRLSIAGAGPERAALERRAHDLGVGERVRFLGEIRRADVPRVLASARLVLLPSRSEGLPLVGIEAALAGRPVVAADVGGMAEVVRSGATGLLIPADDPDALASSIRFLLESPSEVERLGSAAREWAASRFLLSGRIATYTRLYSSLIGGSDG